MAFLSCSKDITNHEILPTTTDQSISTRNSSATLAEQFNLEFCIYDRQAPDPDGGVKYRNAPPVGPGIILQQGAKSVDVTPIRHPDGSIEFVIVDNGEKYILSNSQNEYLKSKKMQTDIPKFYGILYNIAAEITESKYENDDIQTQLGNACEVSVVNRKTKINILNESSFTIDPDVNLYTACSYDKARTVLLYIDKINFSPPNVNSAYYYMVEQALNNCGWNCRACTDAMCAFAYIYNELLPDNFTDKNKLNTAFLGYALQLDEGQIEGFMPYFTPIAGDMYNNNLGNNDYVFESILSMTIDNQLKWPRFKELYFAILADPYVLIRQCVEANSALNINDYAELYNFTIQPSTISALANRGFTNQPIEQGNAATTNLDFYSIQINTRPDFNNNGLPDTDVEIFNRFRQEFGNMATGAVDNFDFACPLASNDYIFWSFEPYNASIDDAKWASSDYVNTVFKIYAGGNIPATNYFADKGAIIISQGTDCCWIGSTIITPFSGTQPFSGNRQWGFYTNSNGKLSFYTKATDTALTEKLAQFMGILNSECDDDTYYEIAYETWTNLQQKAIYLINTNGGNATVDVTNRVRIDVTTLKNKLKSSTPVNFVSCN
ncbi:MAG: hypothetical protein KA103_03460 [Saprospiraceae bacterium]|nr:hypothetical protein [Saprospiraceae bacterium]